LDCELHGAENAITVSATLTRGELVLEWGWLVQAVMSDNAKCDSTSRAFRATSTSSALATS
jgi:hypothetical protein